jgi:hypothetical protein
MNAAMSFSMLNFSKACNRGGRITGLFYSSYMPGLPFQFPRPDDPARPTPPLPSKPVSYLGRTVDGIRLPARTKKYHTIRLSVSALSIEQPADPPTSAMEDARRGQMKQSCHACKEEGGRGKVCFLRRAGRAFKRALNNTRYAPPIDILTSPRSCPHS